jgi:membrane fusion protein (multidrug efflux system)
VLGAEPKGYVTVPRTAVTYGLYGDSVWVAKESAAKPADPGSGAAAAAPAAEPQLVAERRFVRVGPAQDDRVAIVEGVAAGEQVVTSGQIKLHPDAPIKIDNTQGLTPPAERPKQ